jgi:uracil-DNA glycosylase
MLVTAQAPTKPFNGIAIVGEAPGRQEEMFGTPFIGETGQVLDRMLLHAEIDRAACLVTNLFDERPDNNDLKHFCTTKREAHGSYPAERQRLLQDYPAYPWPERYNWPALEPGGYCRPGKLGCVARLHKELGAWRPNVVVAAGNTAIWALLNRTGIRKLRGYVTISRVYGGTKVPSDLSSVRS